jgi:2'-5' RNA ligase
MSEAEVQDAAIAGGSAPVVSFSVPAAIARVRQEWDYAAQVGIGPHVTVLFPFLPVADLAPPIRAELAAIAGAVPAFEVRFERVRRFPDVVWVEPEPAEPFAALTAAVVSRWPAYPPYGGRFETVIPHLTIVESDSAPLDAVEQVARRSTPFPGQARRLELWRQDPTGRWRPHWRLPLAVRP